MERVHENTPRRTPRVAAFVLFVAVLFAFVAETQAAQYLQTTLGYKQPYLIFYIVHSCFLLSFPVHLIYVLFTTQHRLRPLLNGLHSALTVQAIAWNLGRPSSLLPSLFAKWTIPIIIITAFYNLPALLWFIAVPLAPVTDVTAIWNTNAFFAYIFSVKLRRVEWGTLRLSAVMIATLGVLAVVYGGTTTPASARSPSVEAYLSNVSAPLVGDVLTLAASLLYALYQVLYKGYIALPSVPDATIEFGHYHQLPGRADNAVDEEAAAVLCAHEIVYPPPFGLYSNLITSAMGLCTLLVFWIPIPLLHYYQIESFRLPSDTSTAIAIAGIAASGVVFSAGLMILLGIWGPIVTSVGSLLTIVLTFISDSIFGTSAPTFGGLLGAGMIICAFGILAYDTF